MKIFFTHEFDIGSSVPITDRFQYRPLGGIFPTKKVIVLLIKQNIQVNKMGSCILGHGTGKLSSSVEFCPGAVFATSSFK